MHNRAAVVSFLMLGLIGLAALVGPLINRHPYDRVYPDYVKRGPSLTAVPSADEIAPAAQRIAARMRATIGSIDINNGRALITVTSERTIDERLLAYWERSDLFGAPAVNGRADQGRKLTLSIPIKYQRFLFGTESNGGFKNITISNCVFEGCRGLSLETVDEGCLKTSPSPT